MGEIDEGNHFAKITKVMKKAHTIVKDANLEILVHTTNYGRNLIQRFWNYNLKVIMDIVAINYRLNEEEYQSMVASNIIDYGHVLFCQSRAPDFPEEAVKCAMEATLPKIEIEIIDGDSV